MRQIFEDEMVVVFDTQNGSEEWLSLYVQMKNRPDKYHEKRRAWLAWNGSRFKKNKDVQILAEKFPEYLSRVQMAAKQEWGRRV
jgi:hypothetical protein